MPYDIKQLSSGQWAKINRSTGKTVSRHSSKAEAVGHGSYGEVPERPVVKLDKDSSGLFIEPKDSETKTLIEENHNRLRFANKVSYADNYAGNGMTFDEEGRYNCGRCNQAQGNKCLWVDIPEIDLEAGSCKDWENICAGDPELLIQEVSPDVAVYGVAENGVGFGCHRCPFASVSKRGPDSLGRSLWCGYGAFRVFPNSCCALNGAKTV